MKSVEKFSIFSFACRHIGVSSLVVAVLLCTGTVVFAHSGHDHAGGNLDEIEELNQQIAERKNKIEEIQNSIKSYEKKIEDTQLQKVSLSNQTSILENRVKQVELDITATEEKIETLDLEIHSVELTIADKEETIARQQAIIGELLRSIHYSDRKKYIEIAASYDNFSEFYDQIQYVKTVEKHLGSNTRSLRLLKEELEEKRRLKQQQQDNFLALQDELEQKKKDLDEQLFAKEQLLAQSQASERTFQSLLGQLKAQHRANENEIFSIEQTIRQRLEAQNKLKDLQVNGETILSWPTNSRYITARFRDPTYPYRHVFEHNAIDIRAAQGTPLQAAASGYVARTKKCSLASCYAYILIVHSDGLSTLYGHVNTILVNEGQFVSRGQMVGTSGAAPGTIGAGPFTTGPHLHFEVRKDGIPVNPLLYLIKDY